MGRIDHGATLLLAATIWVSVSEWQVTASEPASARASVLRQDETRDASPSDAPRSRPSPQPPSSGGSREVPPSFRSEQGQGESLVPGEIVLDDDIWSLGHTEGFDSGYCTSRLPSGFWASFDYLLWWRQGQPLPPLVTTDPNGGVLPDATVLFGGGREGTGVRPGGRFRGGGWLDMDGVLAAEVGFFALADGRFEFAADSNAHPTLARPFFNFLPGNGPGTFVGPDSLQIAFPNTSTGHVRVAGESEIMGGDVTFRGLLSQSNRTRVDFVAGYHWARIDESLAIFSRTHFGTNQLDVFDSFQTQNRFHGGSIGLELVRSHGRWNLEMLGRIGLGNMQQNVLIDGSSTAVVGGSASTTSGGLLAQPSNIGRFQQNAFAINPEVGLNLNCQVTDRFNLAVGYSLIYWNRVAQPGDQIDPLLAVNPDQPPASSAPARPAFEFRDSSFFLHGLHAGLEFVY